jgi:hypothetical protein
MDEDDKKRGNLERAKTIMGKIDPALLSAALSEMMLEAEEAEEADVAKAKKAIKGIYDSIPEGKDKKSIISKAITELDSDIIEKEVKVIKESLASIDKQTIMEAAKDYVDIPEICKFSIYCIQYPVGGCKLCISSAICLEFLGGCSFAICSSYPLGGCDPAICAYPIGCKFAVCSTYPLGGCKPCIAYKIFVCNYHCLKYAIYEYPQQGEIDPRIKEQIKEEIIQEVLQRPELSRAMKKMLKKIQDEK